MLRASRMNRKKIALTITRPVSFSCVYFTCMKKSTTRVALMVAIVRATMVLNGPRSMKAAATGRVVPASKASQIAMQEPSDEMCSDMCSDVCPDADGHAAFPDAGEGGHDDRQRGRHQQRRADALDRPADDEHVAA